jgi:two-component system, OmpR family, sensor histidine kinase VicK
MQISIPHLFMTEMKSERYATRAIKDIGKLSDDGVFVYNLFQEKLSYCNKSLIKILDVSRNDIADKSFLVLKEHLKDDDDFLRSRLDELVTKSKIMNIEFRLNAKGEKFVSCDAYFIKEKRVIIGFVKDVTHSKKHIDYITEFGARKDAILDMVSRNLSEPLNLTNNLLNMLDQLTVGQPQRKVGNYTRLIRENTQQCIEIINSFMREEHLASKNVFVKPTRFDVIFRIQILIARIKEFSPDQNIKLISDLKELYVSGDDVKFFQVIHNLLTNAVKFTPAKGTITIEVWEKEETYMVSVTDNGIGIPDYLQPYVFNKNTPAGRSGLKGEKSIGMGLYVVKKLVDLMKGYVSFSSEENKGTSFLMELPKDGN